MNSSVRRNLSQTLCTTGTRFNVPLAVNPSLGLTSNLDYKTHSEIINQLTKLGLHDKNGWKAESVGHYARLAAEHSASKRN